MATTHPVYAGVTVEVPAHFLAMLPNRDALALAFIVRTAIREQADRLAGGWFQCPTVLMKSHLSMTPSQISRALTALAGRGFVEVDRAGEFPCPVKLKVRWKAIADARAELFRQRAKATSP